MKKSADPDQLASDANWSGSALFAKVAHIPVQQDQVKQKCVINVTALFLQTA